MAVLLRVREALSYCGWCQRFAGTNRNGLGCAFTLKTKEDGCQGKFLRQKCPQIKRATPERDDVNSQAQPNEAKGG